eukprot:716325_1
MFPRQSVAKNISIYSAEGSLVRYRNLEEVPLNEMFTHLCSVVDVVDTEFQVFVGPQAITCKHFASRNHIERSSSPKMLPHSTKQLLDLGHNCMNVFKTGHSRKYGLSTLTETLKARTVNPIWEIPNGLELCQQDRRTMPIVRNPQSPHRTGPSAKYMEQLRRAECKDLPGIPKRLLKNLPKLDLLNLSSGAPHTLAPLCMNIPMLDAQDDTDEHTEKLVQLADEITNIHLDLSYDHSPAHKRPRHME